MKVVVARRPLEQAVTLWKASVRRHRTHVYQRVANVIVCGPDVRGHDGHAQNGPDSGSDSSLFHAAESCRKILVAHQPLLGSSVRVNDEIREPSLTDIDTAGVIL